MVERCRYPADHLHRPPTPAEAQSSLTRGLERLSKRHLQGVPADEGAAEIEERLKELRVALVAHVEAAEATQPGLGALRHPAVAPQLLAGLDAFAGDAAADPPLAQAGPIGARLVRLVRMQL